MTGGLGKGKYGTSESGEDRKVHVTCSANSYYHSNRIFRFPLHSGTIRYSGVALGVRRYMYIVHARVENVGKLTLLPSSFASVSPNFQRRTLLGLGDLQVQHKI